MRDLGYEQFLSGGRIDFVAGWMSSGRFEVAYIPLPNATEDEIRADMPALRNWREALRLLQGPWSYGSSRDALFEDAAERGETNAALARSLNSWCANADERDVRRLLAHFKWTKPLDDLVSEVRAGWPVFDEGKIRESRRAWQRRQADRRLRYGPALPTTVE